jgi:8-oxo-dGTP pyrophosphatase MutT (NUDIX family)
MTKTKPRYTNRSDFPEQLPTTKTQYCWQCHAPGAYKIEGERVAYACKKLDEISDRVLIYDPNMQAHFDKQKRLVHESCGVFLVGPSGDLLLFKRRKYPFLLSIPAGHLELGEQPDRCAARETEEEVGIHVGNLSLLFTGNIVGDRCLGGADIHHWNAYGALIAHDVQAQLDGEGSSWGWYNPTALTRKNTVQPVIYLLQRPGIREKIMELAR